MNQTSIGNVCGMIGVLDGQVALITGAGSGIGAESARALAAAGAAVVVTDLEGAAANLVAKQASEAGGSAIGLPLDVTDEAAWSPAVAAATEAFGPITVLHGNAAPTAGPIMSRDLDAVRLDLDTWDLVLAVVLRGNLLGCRAVIPGMITAGGGSIVLTSSIKGRTGSTLRTAYSTAKGGLEQLVRSIATGYGRYNIRRNAIAPGIIETPGLHETVGADYVGALQAAHLVPRLGRASDIAAHVVHLASDAASFVTGQTLVVDGGLSGYVPAMSPPIPSAEETP